MLLTIWTKDKYFIYLMFFLSDFIFFLYNLLYLYMVVNFILLIKYNLVTKYYYLNKLCERYFKHFLVWKVQYEMVFFMFSDVVFIWEWYLCNVRWLHPILIIFTRKQNVGKPCVDTVDKTLSYAVFSCKHCNSRHLNALNIKGRINYISKDLLLAAHPLLEEMLGEMCIVLKRFWWILPTFFLSFLKKKKVCEDT